MIDPDLKKFIQSLVDSKRAPAAKTYMSILSAFTAWLRDRNKTLSNFTTSDAEEYFRNIENNNTANMLLGSLKSFLAYKFKSLQPGDPRMAIEHQRYLQLSSIRARPKRSKREKMALTPDEIGELLDGIKGRKNHEVLLAGTIVAFLWGARSFEQEYYMRPTGIKHPAEYRWNKNEMMLWTSKVHHMRFLAWDEKFTPYVKTWVKALPSITIPGEWLTKRLHNTYISGVRITSRVARKSVQTNLRIDGTAEWIIDEILGHENKNSIANTYVDFTMTEPIIKEVLVNNHYLIKHGVIP